MIEVLDKKTGKVLRVARPNEILKDGEVGRISLTLMDAAPPPDIMIGLAALGRDPVVMTADQAKAAHESRERYITRIGSAWKDASPLPLTVVQSSSSDLEQNPQERYEQRLRDAWKATA